MNLDDFEEEAGVELPEGPYETVAGYVVATLGRLPVVGESVVHDGHSLTVIALDGRRASRIRVTRVLATGSPDEGATVGESPT
jgi:putative hemolysin